MFAFLLQRFNYLKNTYLLTIYLGKRSQKSKVSIVY